jgi:GNAT superfamily N-acetyltransferase
MHIAVIGHFLRKYQYFPKEIMNENEIMIRPWRLGDTQGVCEVMREGVMDNVWPYYMLMVKKKLTFFIVLVAASFVHWCWADSIMFTLIALFGIYLTLYFMLLLLGQFYYYYSCTDLCDISKSFFSSELSNFWVAEICEKLRPGDETEANGTIDSGDTTKTNNIIVGIIAVVPKTPDFCYNSNMAVAHEGPGQGKVAWLRRLAVLHHYRGLGVAKKLVEETISFCHHKDFDRIDLITTEGQVASQKLWKKMGFQCVDFKAYRYFKFVKIWTYEFSLDLHVKKD